MSDALHYLLEDTKRYLFIVNRSPINPDTGDAQDVSVTFTEKDPPSLGKSLDPRIRHARRILIILIQNDGGVAKIGLTSRNWEIWIKSATLREKLRTFNEKLRATAHSRFITPGACVAIAFFPFWGPLLAWIGWSFSSAKARHEVYATKSGKTPPGPEWVQHLESVGPKFLPIFILVALVILLIILAGGGLRIWPSYLSSHSFQRAIYVIRSNFALPENLNAPLFTAVVGAVAGGIIVYLLTRYLGG
jgi:hypothetical protein